MIWKTHSSARASPPAYLCLDPRSIHIYWSLVWAGADTRTLAADGPLSWQSITATTLEDIRRSHCAQHKRKPRDLGGNVHKELRHHNPNVRLNSWDERAEYCFFLMMEWRDLKKPGAGALPLCAVTQLAKSVQVTKSKSEPGKEGAAMREGGSSVLHRHLFPSSTSSQGGGLPPLCSRSPSAHYCSINVH